MDRGKKKTLLRAVGFNITRNVVITRDLIFVDGIKFNILDYLKNHFPFKSINYNDEEISVEKFITC